MPGTGLYQTAISVHRLNISPVRLLSQNSQPSTQPTHLVQMEGAPVFHKPLDINSFRTSQRRNIHISNKSSHVSVLFVDNGATPDTNNSRALVKSPNNLLVRSL